MRRQWREKHSYSGLNDTTCPRQLAQSRSIDPILHPTLCLGNACGEATKLTAAEARGPYSAESQRPRPQPSVAVSRGPKYRIYLGFLCTPIYPLVYSQTRIFMPSYDCCVASRTTSLATSKGNANASSLSDRAPVADWQAAAANNVDLTRRGYAA